MDTIEARERAIYIRTLVAAYYRTSGDALKTSHPDELIALTVARKVAAYLMHADASASRETIATLLAMSPGEIGDAIDVIGIKVAGKLLGYDKIVEEIRSRL